MFTKTILFNKKKRNDLPVSLFFLENYQSDDYSFSFAKYMANERYRKCVHLPKGTMINAH